MGLPDENKNANDRTHFELSSYIKPLLDQPEQGFTHSPMSIDPRTLNNRQKRFNEMKSRSEIVARRALSPYFSRTDLDTIRTLGTGFFAKVFSVQSGGLHNALCRIEEDSGRFTNMRNVLVNDDLTTKEGPHFRRLSQRLATRFAVKVECLTYAMAELKKRGNRHIDDKTMQVKAVSENINHLAYNRAVFNHTQKISLRAAYQGGMDQSATATFNGYSFSPIFCAGFTVDDTGPGSLPATYRITLMECIDGQPLGKTVDTLRAQRRTLDLSYYVQLEYAIAIMWKAGIIHTDMHLDNIMVSKTDGLIKIIDFGMAVNLPMLHREAEDRYEHDWADVTSKVMAETAQALEKFTVASEAGFMSRIYKPPIKRTTDGFGRHEPERAPNYFEVARVLMIFRKLGKFNPESLALDLVRAATGYPEDRDLLRGPQELAAKWKHYLKVTRIKFVLRAIPFEQRRRAYSNTVKLPARPTPMGTGKQPSYVAPIQKNRNRFLRRMARWMRIRI